jgi:solute carrier family 12 (sodium/potassium/chloride transporter), member 2
VLTGSPNTRPLLVNFGYLLTKKLSLLVCGHVVKGVTTQKYRNFLARRAHDWYRRHKVKGFYTQVDDADFETGCRALMQVIHTDFWC